MRVLVTGGAGFIGSHTVDLLLSEGIEVVALDNLDPQVHRNGSEFPPNLQQHRSNRRLQFIHADVRNRERLAYALEGVDAVLHLAAAVGVGQSMYEPLYYTDVNLTGTAALLQVIAEKRLPLKKLVVASSMSIYGEGAYRCDLCHEQYPSLRDSQHETDGQWDLRCPQCAGRLIPVPTKEHKPLQPTSIYAITKQTQEEMALCFGPAYGIPTVALRYFNTCGPRQALSNPYTGVVAIFLARLLNGKPPLVFEDGLQSRDFIYVRDIARANFYALTKDGIDSTALNVGTGQPTTILALARLLAESLGVSIEPTVLNRLRTGDVRHCYADITRIRQQLGWEPQTSLEKGLEELLAWAREQRPVDHVEQAIRELSERGLAQ